jgi:type I restriction enzyme S subunit
VIAKLRPYRAYQDCSLPWLERLPNGLRTLRGKNVFDTVDVRSETGEEEILTVSSSDGVVPRSQKRVTMFKAESYVGHKLCWPGDLVINSLWAWMKGLGFSEHHGLVSSAYGVYRPKPPFRSRWRFFDYLLRSAAYKWELQTRSKGVWLSRLQLSDSAFLDMPIVVPPAADAVAIARFLDYIDRRTRRYIRAQRKLIALLEEQKQAIIQHAVTRGLDPNIRLKPSRVDWLGEIPEHWEIQRLKFLASHIVDCLHATPTYSDDGEYPAIRTADMVPGRVLTDRAKRIARDQYLLWTSRLRPREGDILYTREGERFGLAAIVPADVELCISQRMMVFRIRDEHHSGFVMWQLNAPHVYAQATQDLFGATSPHVNVERIRNYLLAVPPLSEQVAIAAWIQERVESLDEMVIKAEREINLIREYRTRLIADVVTGKLDVRQAAANLPEEAEEPEDWDETEEPDEDETMVDDDQEEEA